jgi:hypothetical protein
MGPIAGLYWGGKGTKLTAESSALVSRERGHRDCCFFHCAEDGAWRSVRL